jgi:hypothetical protein
VPSSLLLREFRRILFIGLSIASVATLSHANAPQGRYTRASVNGVAAVNDNATGLVWQQSFGGVHADGGAGLYALADAQSYCTSLGDAWRLPSVEELQTIVDEKALNPSVDITVFRDTPPDYFWTGSALPGGSPADAWWVHFGAGISGSTGDYDFVVPRYARCVR